MPAGAEIKVDNAIAPENTVRPQPNSSVIGPTRTLIEGLVNATPKKETVNIEPMITQP